MFIDTVIYQALWRRFHRRVDDALLDRCASASGCAPIGRMCLLDDSSAAEIADRCAIRNGTRVLDLGCGRGFFGRWLLARGTAVRYSGLDRDAEAVAAARRHVPDGTITRGDFRAMQWGPEYDVVVAIEAAIDGTLDDALLRAAREALAEHGSFAATIASLDGAHADRLAALERAAGRRFATATIEDWTKRARSFAQRTFEWWLQAPWPAEIQEKCALEARAVLDAIEQNRLHYAVLFARA